MAEFESSSDLYFEPNDPAVWNPEKFSPQQRLRNFLPLWPKHHVAHNHSSRSSSLRYNVSAMNSPAATRYLITATGDHTTVYSEKLAQVHPPIHPESIPILSDSPGSLTRTSYSSEDLQEVKDADDDVLDDGVESCCGSLTYSVESDMRHVHQHLPHSHSLEDSGQYHHHHHYYFPSSVSTLPDDVDIYEDALETLDEHRGYDRSKKAEQQHQNMKERGNCFEMGTAGDCFHPLAWIGELFRVPPTRSLYVSSDENSGIATRER